MVLLNLTPPGPVPCFSYITSIHREFIWPTADF